MGCFFSSFRENGIYSSFENSYLFQNWSPLAIHVLIYEPLNSTAVRILPLWFKKNLARKASF